jgi:valyl-tRNA synthetase
MQLLHPFMPFITEELWQNLREREKNESIMYSTFPKSEPKEENHQLLNDFEAAKKIIENIRHIRTEHNIPIKNNLDLIVKAKKTPQTYDLDEIIKKLANPHSIQYQEENIDTTLSFIEQNVEYFIPYKVEANIEEEVKKIEDELRYTKGFLQTTLKKLANEKFVNGAPETVVAMERKKQADAEEKITLLEAKLAQLNQTK